VHETLAGRLAGAIWGRLVGDAVGVPDEFGPGLAPETVEFRGDGAHGRPAGTWSDDGALMLALLDALLPDGARVPQFDLGTLRPDCHIHADRMAAVCMVRGWVPGGREGII
jgi:ADP-ribosylglycohydrolase